MDYPGKVITKNQVTPTQTSAPGVWTLDDAASATKNNNWPVAGVPNPISKSLRFNSADSAYLNRTPSSTGNRRTFTFSAWVKLSSNSTDPFLMGAGSGGQIWIISDKLRVRLNGSPDYYYDTAAVLRDFSAWYHIVVGVDTTNATSADRVKIYINGTQQTIGASAVPPQNFDTEFNLASTANNIGKWPSGTQYLNGYLTEINFIDGSALTPSSFGMTDPQTGAWIPIKYTGTYGTNGFYLNFKDSSSTSALGYDYSGNTNNWTTNNFSVTAGSGNDSLTDVPTPWIAYNTTGDIGGVMRGNYCTFNAVAKASTQPTFSNGNLDLSASAAWNGAVGTIGVTSGKWYWEVVNGNTDCYVGICGDNLVLTTADPQTLTGTIVYYGFNGNKRIDGTSTSYGASYTTETIGVALDVDGGTVTFYKNNTSQGSISLSSSTLNGRTIFPFFVKYSSTVTVNFGQRPFAYTPPAGYLSLCTTNLPNPTIGTSSTTQAGKYFNTVLWTGTGGARTITGVGFQPDFVWAKGRSGSATYPNLLWDAVRGTNLNLISSTTDAELNVATGSSNGGLGTYASDGFTIVAGTSTADNLNASSPASTYVGWCWKGNGSGSTNTAGSITSTVSASTVSGCSIVTYTGNNTAGATVGHGLGVAPSMIIIKNTDLTENWAVYHSGLSAPSTSGLLLNTTAAVYTGVSWWNSTNPSSSVITLGSGATLVNGNTRKFVAYCFAPIAGYSAFGSYIANANTDGPFVYCNFRPRWVLVKCASSAENWAILDTARDTYNVMGKLLRPNISDAELDSPPRIDIVSNGFKVRAGSTALPNGINGDTYIYAAFAEFPFKFANAR
jgi:hypothetical protein